MKIKLPATRATIFTFAVLLILASCQAINDAVSERMLGGIQTGTWSEDGKTFINEWSNLSITLAAYWIPLRQFSQIKTMMYYNEKEKQSNVKKNARKHS